jgi:hypothetical protein
MSNKLIKLSFVVLIIAVGIGFWFFEYYNNKTLDNIPAPSVAAQMEEAEINSILPGYSIDQLIEVWGVPQSMTANEAIWQLDENIQLKVNFKNNKEIAICEFVTELIQNSE